MKKGERIKADSRTVIISLKGTELSPAALHNGDTTTTHGQNSGAVSSVPLICCAMIASRMKVPTQDSIFSMNHASNAGFIAQLVLPVARATDVTAYMEDTQSDLG